MPMGVKIINNDVKLVTLYLQDQPKGVVFALPYQPSPLRLVFDHLDDGMLRPSSER